MRERLLTEFESDKLGVGSWEWKVANGRFSVRGYEWEFESERL